MYNMHNQSPEPQPGYNPQDYDPLGGISSPDELRNVLIGFMGQTYSEVSKFDKHLVSPNVTLRPKTAEFHNMAERLLSEANNICGDRGIQQQRPPVLGLNMQHQPQINKTDIITPSDNPQIQQNFVDPNQLEFKFDNSATAESIQRKLDDIMLKLCAIQDRIDKLTPKPSEY